MKHLINVDSEKCVNCHQCIAACPVKFANNGSGDYVSINHDLCIGCGECIKACQHEARGFTDELETCFELLKLKTPMVAIAAPAVISNFEKQYKNLNGWLRSMGIDAVFDVSFGAELTVRSYVDYIEKEKPTTVIAQPCPAIVTYIEIYQPELLRYLAPVDSPMLHTVKMIREFYPEYRNHQILVLSPCVAKLREFDDTASGIYNVTVKRLNSYIEEKKIDLNLYPEIEYHEPHAGIAAGFSSPGGLLETVADSYPNLRNMIRKIEGPKLVYDYLRKLPEQIAKGNAPLIVDILNCENGCNGGTGTCFQETSPDELETKIKKRIENLRQTEEQRECVKKNIEQYWIENLYTRSYRIKSENLTHLSSPNETEMKEIMLQLHKTTPEHILNCAACGYNSCETMCKAIFNDLNRKENCHHYLQEEMKMITSNLDSLVKLKTEEAEKQKDEVVALADDLLGFMKNMHSILEG